MGRVINSLIIPVYKNEDNIESLLKALNQINIDLQNTLEVIFVVDGSPDKSFEVLDKSLSNVNFESQLILHSKNFGSFSAIRTGLKEARGKYFAVMAADLQEPPELVTKFFNELVKEDNDIIIAKRDSRNDPFFSKLASTIFWKLYRKFIVSEMPEGGIDVFACNELAKEQLLLLNESHSSLIAQIFWIGFRRKEISYIRQEREIGVSSWTFRKKVKYMMDSIFSFTDLPIRLLISLGFLGIVIFGFTGILTFIAKLLGMIDVQGYTTIFLTVGFFGAINIFGLGIVGSYTWRTYENTKQRPLSINQLKKTFLGKKKVNE